MSSAPVLTSARAEGFFESRWQCWSGKVGLLSLQVVEHAFGVGRSGMAAIRVSFMLGSYGHVVVFVGIGGEIWKWGAYLAKRTRSSARS